MNIRSLLVSTFPKHIYNIYMITYMCTNSYFYTPCPKKAFLKFNTEINNNRKNIKG